MSTEIKCKCLDILCDALQMISSLFSSAALPSSIGGIQTVLIKVACANSCFHSSVCAIRKQRFCGERSIE
ncbi:unnamed protein product [Trifolium pratense]|uniref:Uncharacterized protein n=1 Tax=Trifolium pratense TaxID=57577 RepID=A0ACB0JJZ0_TRIPR|nr:unnamed protein product [Trifolium pratense]